MLRDAMLRGLTRGLRFRAALALAALYAFCVIAPHAAFALTHAVAHCLTEPHGAAHVHQPRAKVHVHADGVAHTHGNAAPQQQSNADGKDHDGTCCGLFCVTALAHEPAPTLSAPLAARLIGPGQQYERAGRGPERINRPPIG